MRYQPLRDIHPRFMEEELRPDYITQNNAVRNQRIERENAKQQSDINKDNRFKRIIKENDDE